MPPDYTTYDVYKFGITMPTATYDFPTKNGELPLEILHLIEYYNNSNVVFPKRELFDNIRDGIFTYASTTATETCEQIEPQRRKYI
jgi:hypothetical protein